MDKNQKEEQRRQEDMALNRGLMWVGAAVVLELLLLLVNKYFINYSMSPESINLALAFQTGLKAVRVIGLVGAAVGAVLTFLKLKKNDKACVPAAASIVSMALLFCSHVALSFTGSGMRMLFILVPAWAALALVYFLYQREFFFSAAFTSLGAVSLWMIRYGAAHPMTMYGILVLTGVVLVAGAVVLGGVRQAKGELTVFGNKVQLLPEDANYAVMLATAVVNVAAIALGLLLGATLAYCLVYVLVAWLFGLLVFYTVKMM